MDDVLCILLQPDVLEVIEYTLGGPYGAANLRATCKALRDRISVPKRMKADVLLFLAAKNGLIYQCRAAKRYGTTNFDNMLDWGAVVGRGDLCHLAKKWGATDFDRMMGSAMVHGHVALCRLARKWGAYWKVLLYYAPVFATNGRTTPDNQEKLLGLSKEWETELRLQISNKS